jgi:hypothetical protein
VLDNGGGVVWQKPWTANFEIYSPWIAENCIFRFFCTSFYWFKTCNWYKLQKSLQFPLICVFFLVNFISL